MADIIISDDFVDGAGQFISTETQKIEETLTSYLRIMQSVSETGIMEGDTAEALKIFIAAAARLQGVFSNLGSCTKRACTNFIEKVDDADEYLY